MVSLPVHVQYVLPKGAEQAFTSGSSCNDDAKIYRDVAGPKIIKLANATPDPAMKLFFTAEILIKKAIEAIEQNKKRPF